MLTITWENTPKIKKYILKLMGKTVNENGVVINSKNNQPVVDSDGQELTLDTFGLAINGSEIYVKDNIVSVANFLNKYKK